VRLQRVEVEASFDKLIEILTIFIMIGYNNQKSRQSSPVEPTLFRTASLCWPASTAQKSDNLAELQFCHCRQAQPEHMSLLPKIILGIFAFFKKQISPKSNWVTLQPLASSIHMILHTEINFPIDQKIKHSGKITPQPLGSSLYSDFLGSKYSRCRQLKSI
jgi:hypothetical protein